MGFRSCSDLFSRRRTPRGKALAAWGAAGAAPGEPAQWGDISERVRRQLKELGYSD